MHLQYQQKFTELWGVKCTQVLGVKTIRATLSVSCVCDPGMLNILVDEKTTLPRFEQVVRMLALTSSSLVSPRSTC